jgi:hypothetical protein
METRRREEQIIGALKRIAAGRKVLELASELGVSEGTCLVGRRPQTALNWY